MYAEETRDVEVLLTSQEEALGVIQCVFMDDTYGDLRTWHLRELTDVPESYAFVDLDGSEITDEAIAVPGNIVILKPLHTI